MRIGDVKTVAVIGGGLGGLALAQGLTRAGIDVTVYERDAAFDARAQGYRLSLDAMGRAALAALLPAERAARLVALEAREVGRGFAFADARTMRPLFRFADGGEAGVWTVSRPRLRALLLEGLRVEWGRRLARFDADGDGVTLRFDDGSAARAELVVGCDGVGSAVREQLRASLAARAAARLPTVVATGLASVGGFVPRTAAWDALLPVARAGAVQHLGPAGRSLFVSFCEQPDGAPVVLWAATRRAESVAAERPDLGPGWHPTLRRLVEETPDEAIIEPLLLRTSRVTVPRAGDGPLAPSGRVTLLGDAAHVMPPQRGVGANNAFEDARRMTRALVDGAGPLASRVAAYEREMLARARRAIDDSDDAARLCHVQNPLGAHLRNAALRIFAAGAVLTRRRAAA